MKEYGADAIDDAIPYRHEEEHPSIIDEELQKLQQTQCMSTCKIFEN